MPTILKFVWEVTIFAIVFAFMFVGLSRVDFSKIFKANSTIHIKIVVLILSLATAAAISLGLGELIELFGLLFK